LISFPTLALLIYGRDGVAYAHDVFDVVRTGVVGDWLTYGPTLWGNGITSGNALLGQQAMGPFALDVPLAMLLGPFAAFVVNSWLLAAVAGIGMHLFLRDVLRLSTVAVLAGAILYTFVFWQPLYGYAVPAVPLALWLLHGAATEAHGSWRFVGVRILVLAFVIYNSQAQIALLIAGLEFAWILVTGWGDRTVLRRWLAVWFGTWLGASALYAPVLLTQLVLLPLSQRTIWVLADFWPSDAVRAATRLYSATLFGNRVATGIGNSPNVYGTFFLGAIGLALAVLGLVQPTRDRRRWYLIGLLIAIPIADVVTTAVIPHLESIGFLKSFQLNRIRHFFPFALVGVAACGADVLARALARGESPVRGWRAVVVGLAMIPVVVSLLVAVGRVVTRRAALRAFDPNALGWAAAALTVAVGLLAVIAVLVWAWRRGTFSARAASVVLGGLLLVLLIERPVYAYAERLMDGERSTWNADVTATPAIEFLQQQPGIDRDRALAFGEFSARLATAGIRLADGYQGMYPLTYHGVFGALTAPELAVQPDRWTYFHHWGNRAETLGPGVDPDLVKLLGIRWLYVRGDEVPTVPGIVPRFKDGDVTVYEVPDPLPRAFVVPGVEQLPNDAAVLDALAAADADTLRNRAFMTAAPGTEDLPAPAGEAAGTATITEYTPDVVRIATEGDGGVLVLTETWAPGWQAEVDGEPATIHRVDGAFRGVALEPGAHEVVFRYVPAFTYAGFAVLLLGLAGTALAVVLLRRRERGSAGEP
jgi:hypothetical protein